MIELVAVPVAIFVVLLAVGVFASTRWLPDLAAGTVGAISLFVVCGLDGFALAVFGLSLYETIEEAKGLAGFRGGGDLLAAGLERTLWESGILLGLAAGVYLLAPKRRTAGEHTSLTGA